MVFVKYSNAVGFVIFRSFVYFKHLLQIYVGVSVWKRNINDVFHNGFSFICDSFLFTLKIKTSG